MTSLSLLATVKKDSEYKVYLNKDGELFTVLLHNHGVTIENAIIESVNKFNTEHQLGLIEDPSQYQMFGARKSGKRKDDLPAFEKTQLLGQTCLKNFYLMPMYTTPKLRSKDSEKSIETEITLQPKGKNQKAQFFSFGCFYCRKGSMK